MRDPRKKHSRIAICAQPSKLIDDLRRLDSPFRSPRHHLKTPRANLDNPPRRAADKIPAKEFGVKSSGLKPLPRQRNEFEGRKIWHDDDVGRIVDLANVVYCHENPPEAAVLTQSSSATMRKTISSFVEKRRFYPENISTINAKNDQLGFLVCFVRTQCYHSIS